MKGSPQKKIGIFQKRREGVTIWWGLVCKHVSEKEKSLVVVNLAGSDKRVVEKCRHPFV